MKPADALLYRRLTGELGQEHMRRLGQPGVEELQRDKKLLDDLTLHTIIAQLPMDNVFFVAADMTALAIAASADVPEITRMETTLAEPYGYMVFESPIGESIGPMDPSPNKQWILEEGHGRLADDGRVASPIQGFIWRTITDGETAEQKFVYAWLTWVRHDTLYAPDWATLHFGEPVSSGTDEMIGDELPVGELEKRLWVTHILMQQTLAWSETVHAERPERRRWQRAGLPASHVNVVKMRRVERAQEDGLESSVAWTHRWLVSGHWRQQWYPSTRTHRPMWISPHVKGPADKPFVAKERVIAWVR